MRIMLTDDQGRPLSELDNYDVIFVPKEGGRVQNLEMENMDKRINTLQEESMVQNEKPTWLDRIKARYPYTLRCVIIAAILSLSFLILGFWRTIGISILLLIGYIIGGVLDSNPIVLRFLKNFR